MSDYPYQQAQQPYQQPYQSQPPQYQQPQLVYQQPAPYVAVQAPGEISGGLKAGMFFAGMFLSALSLCIVWIMSKSKTDAQAKEMVKWSFFGILAEFVLALLFVMLVFGLLFTTFAAILS